MAGQRLKYPSGPDKDETRRVLIVDDDADFSEALKDILESRGYMVQTAISRRRAIAANRAFEPHVALVDIQLGSASGVEVVGELQRDRTTELVCVIITAHAEIDSAIGAMRVGADDYLRKPLSAAELIDTMERSFAKLRLLHDKKAADEALVERESLLRSVIDGSTDLIFVKDRDGRLLLVNDAVTAAVGRDANEIISELSMADLLPPSAVEKIEAKDQEVIVEGKPKMSQDTIAFGDEARTFDVMRAPYRSADGTVAGVISVSRDVTERKRTEEQLRQAQKQEAIGQLTGGMAHDFNNLLGIVLGNLEMLLARVSDDPTSGMLAQTSIDAALRGAELTRRLLAFARRQSLQPRATDVNKLVGDAMLLIGGTMAESIEIKTRLADDLWPAEVDPAELEAAILNLAINARDAMPDGGCLTIETCNTPAEENRAGGKQGVEGGDSVMLAVKDTGMGMSKSVMSQAFEPFFTTKGVGEGSGLGLSMVHGFANQSGGSIQIRSKQRRGTIVTIFLPRAPGDDALERDAPERSAGVENGAMPKGNETVLVVEDDREMRSLAVSLLEDLGYTTIEAVDGPTALDVLANRRDIDLLFTDIVMPGGMTGIELAQNVRAHNPGIRVLLMSGYTEDANIRDRAVRGEIQRLAKPYRKQELAHKVRAVLDSEATA